MEEKLYKITLADGTELDGLRFAGNYYISDTAIDAALFDGNCSRVIVDDGETEEVLENMELAKLSRIGDEYWFLLRETAPETFCTVTLADGTKLENLRLNGDNFISSQPVTPDMFEYNCAPVVINNGVEDEVHENMELIQITQMNGEYWFALRDIPAKKLSRIKTQSDIEYIAMMSGIEL